MDAAARASRAAVRRGGLDDVEQFHVEHQGRVRADRAARGALLAVAELGRDPQLELAADRHQRDAFLPARHHRAEREHRRLVAIVGAVEGLAVEGGALVVHAHGVGGLGLGALALADDLVLQARSGGHHAGLLAVSGEEFLALFLVLLGRRHHLLDLLVAHGLLQALADLHRFLVGQRDLLALHAGLHRLLQHGQVDVVLEQLQRTAHVHADQVAVLLLLGLHAAQDLDVLGGVGRLVAALGVGRGLVAGRLAGLVAARGEQRRRGHGDRQGGVTHERLHQTALLKRREDRKVVGRPDKLPGSG